MRGALVSGLLQPCQSLVTLILKEEQRSKGLVHSAQLEPARWVSEPSLLLLMGGGTTVDLERVGA